MDEQLNETKATTEEKGSVVLPLVAGAGAAYGTKHFYSKASNQLVTDARNNANGVKADIAKAAREALAEDPKVNLREAHNDIESLKRTLKPEEVKSGQAATSKANVDQITIEKLNKGHKVTIKHGNHVSDFHVDTLKGEASKAFASDAKAGAKKIYGGVKPEDIKELEELTKGGEKSWVSKTVGTAEKELNASVRSTKAWKEVGGLKATFGHMGGMKAAGVIGAGAVAGIGLYTGVKNIFSSHSNRVEAERAAPAPAGKAV